MELKLVDMQDADENGNYIAIIPIILV